MQKYQKLSNLQGALLINAPHSVIFNEVARLKSRASVSPARLLTMLYNADGSLNMTQVEVANELGISKSAVNQQFCRILRRLRHELCRPGEGDD